MTSNAPTQVSIISFLQDFIKKYNFHFQGQDLLLAQIPLGNFGFPEDIAETAAFLASERAKYINGAAIDVNGGLC